LSDWNTIPEEEKYVKGRPIRGVTTNKLIDYWNNLIDYGLEKLYSFLVFSRTINGSTYYYAHYGSGSNKAGKLAYGGPNNAGGIDGTDAGAVVQALVDTLPGNDPDLSHWEQPVSSVFFKRGKYFFKSKISIVNKQIFFKGEFWKGTVLVQDFVNDDLFYIYGGATPNQPNTVSFQDISLYGNRGKVGWTDRTKAGIRIEGFTKDMVFHRLYVTDFYGYGIHAPYGGLHNDVYWLDCAFENCYNNVYFNSSGYYRFIKGCYFFNAERIGLYLRSTNEIFIQQCSFNENGRQGLVFLGSQGCHIENCDFVNNCAEANNVYNQVELYGVSPTADYKLQNSRFINCSIWSKKTNLPKYALFLGANIDSVFVTKNAIKNAVTQLVYVTAGENPNGKIWDNTGYITENSGTATFTSGSQQVWVAHGLSTIVNARFYTQGHHSEVKDIIVNPANVNASQFRCDLSAPVTADRTFWWRAIVE